MIDPRLMISGEPQEDEDVIEMEGSYGCPQQGCYETTRIGKFDIKTRSVTWTCVNGHKGSATI